MGEGIVKFLQDTCNEVRNKHDFEIMMREQELGIHILIKALIFNKIKDERIIQTVQKYYDLKRSEVEIKIQYVKNVDIKVDELVQFMNENLDFTIEEAWKWVWVNKIDEKINDNKSFSQLSSKALWEQLNKWP
ncbi:hypothetical protein SAMN02745111_01702 [Eubacterium uniforme]|uniref:Uncharacterized protein n=1 Tax=Eubacterium uniforme TaxID=39495 RepID=A0A1T4VVW1_9FIRM|nr:hypothetical protein [Eubacterium uniforme]SKA68955.1 hypothetical protein SAMN02745111_01702 [Eubacterium uniforme]